MKIIVITILVMMMGCATSPIPTKDALLISGDQLLSNKYSEKFENSGEVIVKRDSGVMGSACAIKIFVDGEIIAELDTEEKVVLHLSPGEHILSAISNDPCGGVQGLAVNR